ncbi:MAG: TIGR01458 family HAD-type hydrolase, partial [Planctomycetota bacterium]|nr:TIGR01458 family HAD-type hydrolase [Planctomycetota bacterium]
MRGLLFDLDGVVYNAESAIDGAAAAIRAVRDRDVPHLFVTNTTSRPRSALVAKLDAMGIETDTDHIMTPAVAAASWLRRQPEGRVALFLRPAARVAFEGLPRVAGHA